MSLFDSEIYIFVSLFVATFFDFRKIEFCHYCIVKFILLYKKCIRKHYKFQRIYIRETQKKNNKKKHFIRFLRLYKPSLHFSLSSSDKKSVYLSLLSTFQQFLHVTSLSSSVTEYSKLFLLKTLSSTARLNFLLLHFTATCIYPRPKTPISRP